MPIIDIQVVSAEHQVPVGLAQSLADALGLQLTVTPGHLWLRLSSIPATAYAENEATVGPAQFPVFVRVLHADLPDLDALALQAAAISKAVGLCLGRLESLVHVEYASSGRGRIAFGGKLLQ